jgi:hypothetical protein
VRGKRERQKKIDKSGKEEGEAQLEGSQAKVK